MKQTETLIVGASIAGLATASCLYKKGIKYILIEKQAQVASPWRNHYERLHLHTNKRISHLPYKKFGPNIQRYPSREEVIKYLEDYQKEFIINPVLNTAANLIQRENGYWITHTNAETYKSRYLVMATGPFGKAMPVDIEGMETFSGPILHSSTYKTGKDFKGQKVLVVGFGNSACEIAIDLFEQGAFPSMSVRSAVNVLPRDILGIPVLELSLLLHRLPVRLADAISAPLIRLYLGDITKLGLRKKPYGPFEEIQKDYTTPVLDIGVIQHIRKGHIAIFKGIDLIKNSTVYFSGGQQQDFDAIIACFGYYSNCAEIIGAGKERFEDLKSPVHKQQFFGKDGLYFCGFWVGPTGQIREIGLDAKKIATDIALTSTR